MMSADENGITAHGSTNPSTTTYGASLNSRASASSGMMSSFSTFLMPSASHCRKPLRPDAVRPDARLDARPHAALDPAGDAGEREGHTQEDHRAKHEGE